MNGSPHYLIGYFRGLLRTAKDKSMSDTYVLNEMHRILAFLIYLFCQFEDFQQVGKNGAVRNILAKS